MSTLRIQLRRGTAVQWSDANPVLRAGEPGYEKDTNQLKIGDGKTPWNDLAYSSGDGGDGGGVVDLGEHINDPTPHPVYDDGPSLILLYENAKV